MRPCGNSSGNFVVDPVDGGHSARQIAQGKVESLGIADHFGYGADRPGAPGLGNPHSDMTSRTNCNGETGRNEEKPP